MVAEPRASDLQPERQAVREPAGRKRQRRMAGCVLDRGVVHLTGQRPHLVVCGQAPSASQPWLAIVGESTTLAAAVGTDPARANGAGRHVVCYADADLSANLAQLGSLAAPVVAGDKVAGALGQHYGIDGAVLVRADGPVTEPHSTSDKPDKIIVLFRHFVRALLISPLAQVLDTQAGFNAFDAAALGPAIRQMTSFNETSDVELLIHLAQHNGPQALAVEPIVFTEDFAATNFPSVEPGPRRVICAPQLTSALGPLTARN
jgi:hypothetical protein